MFRKEAKVMLLIFALPIVLGLLVALIAPQLIRGYERAREKVKQEQSKEHSETEVTYPPTR